MGNGADGCGDRTDVRLRHIANYTWLRRRGSGDNEQYENNGDAHTSNETKLSDRYPGAIVASSETVLII